MQFPTAASDLDSGLQVLSAMITPAVLILASGSLILTTSNRLVRVLDRVREMVPEVEKLATSQESTALTNDKWLHLFEQLDRATRRARLLQRALTRLYIGLGIFLATSVSIGVVSMYEKHIQWLPLLLGFVGIGFMFAASILMIFESRIALQATLAEMDFIRHISKNHAPPGRHLSGHA